MWDGLVIGGGIAGLMAGIRAQERGKRVLIVSVGTGSLAFASGVLDFGRVELLRQEEKHPYVLLGETAEKAFSYFLQCCPSHHGVWGRTGMALTPLGTLRAADLLPEGLDASPLTHANRIVLVVPEGLKDFFPEVVKANLQKQFISSTIQLKRLRIEEFVDWQAVGKPIPDTVYAKFWCSEQGRETLKNLIGEMTRKMVSDSETLVFPGLHVAACPEVEKILAQAPLPVVEMTSFPPSAAGQVLYDRLRGRFKALGGELLIGSGVERVEVESGQARRAIVKSKGKEISFTAKAFVLATGGFFGRGIVASSTEVRETVFGLPLYVPPEWSESSFLGAQPYAYTGVEVDHSLRPCDPVTGKVLLENVFVVGRMLAHWDPWVGHCGGGVSLTSGFLAGGLL
ncbi:MAG: anaerobic glycerol-3-phosphate dehydrogenase subunit GlpB [Desulfitobacteriaceae bacterium]|nr:anaerobic glycerol-3-phosphate dehydrogenase subunit GlpB [Desulfitobacteriaceae bacterium]MDI6913402.1 anaerobic glycerol-3-phosphate dehydrogenase subunit GlpB [Desulfitobacteriaceae bacterium]